MHGQKIDLVSPPAIARGELILTHDTFLFNCGPGAAETNARGIT